MVEYIGRNHTYPAGSSFTLITTEEPYAYLSHPWLIADDLLKAVSYRWVDMWRVDTLPLLRMLFRQLYEIPGTGEQESSVIRERIWKRSVIYPIQPVKIELIAKPEGLTLGSMEIIAMK